MHSDVLPQAEADLILDEFWAQCPKSPSCSSFRALPASWRAYEMVLTTHP